MLSEAATRSGGTVLSTNGLAVRFGRVRALDGIDVGFRRQQLTVLLGASGSGKSTLLRCLNGLQAPTVGEVVAEGIGVLDRWRRIRRHQRRTGMIFQLHHLVGRQSALANVLVGRLGHQRLVQSWLPPSPGAVELALDCLARVGIADKALERASALSGGERQRVGIARALAQQPTIMLADEPVASLDPAAADVVLRLLRDICHADGLTAVVSLHQVDLARRFAERIVGLRRGRVVFDGPPADLDRQAERTLYRHPTTNESET